MEINKVAADINKWVESVGWHNKTTLEYLALIASEVGEAINECRGPLHTPYLEEELADILIRVLDLAEELNMDMEYSISTKMMKNKLTGNKGRLK